MSYRLNAQIPATFVVSLTPFAPDGSLDEDALRAHLRRMRMARIGVYVGGSGSGEGMTLTRHETFRVYEIAREELGGHVPVRAMGVEPRTAAEMLDLAALATEAGLDAIQVYSPLAPGASAREIEEFFADALRSIIIPAVISTHHTFDYTVPLDVVGRIVDGFPHVIGVNATHADVRLVDRVGTSVAVHVADVGSVLNNLAFGGHGFLTRVANLVPELCVRVIDQFKAGGISAAGEAYAALARTDGYRTQYLPSISGIKAALTLLGLPSGYPRKPRLALQPEEIERIRSVIDVFREKENLEQ